MMTEIRLSTIEEVFSGQPLQRRFKKLEPLPISGFRLRIRSLTERESADYQAKLVAKKGDGLRTERLKDANRRLIALCLVDEEGNTYVTPTMQAQLGNWDAADTGFLYDECANHCGLNKSDIEDLVKNSEETTVAD